jgi:hypothetical protein
MILREANPILKEFGYHLDEWDTVIVQYGDGNNHIQQVIKLDTILSFQNKQELRKFLFHIYNKSVNTLKENYKTSKWILPERIL